MERVGFHVSTAGGVSNAFLNAREIGCNTMQIFLSSPQMWAVNPISKEEARKFAENSQSFDVKPVFVHMPYLPNLASPHPDAFRKSVDTLVEIAKGSQALAIPYVVIHLGSRLGESKEKGMANVVSAVNEALDATEDVHILLEDQAGTTNTVGADVNDLKDIYKQLGSRNVGLCLDTCHLFAAGYDIRERKVLEEIDKVLDFRNVKAIHLNDALFGLGSFKDRHERIGFGQIGEKGIGNFLSFKKVRGIPMIMETPHETIESQIRELELVRKLLD